MASFLDKMKQEGVLRGGVSAKEEAPEALPSQQDSSSGSFLAKARAEGIIRPAVKQDTKPVPESMKQVTAARLGTEQGLTFGFSDELRAALKAATSDETYEGAVEKERQLLKEAEEQWKKTYIGGQVAGGVVSGVLLPGANILRAGKAATTMGRAVGMGALKAGATGAVEGAVTGIGMSEAKDAVGVAKDAASGAVLGAAVGVPIGAAFGAVAKTLASRNINKGVADVAAEEAAEMLRNGDNVSPEGLEATIKLLEDDSLGVERRAIELYKKAKAKGTTGSENDFINYTLVRPAGSPVGEEELSKFDEIMRGLGQTTRQEQRDAYLMSRARLAAADEIRDAKAYKIVGMDDPLQSRMARALKNVDSNFRAVDNELGTNLSGLETRAAVADRRTNAQALPMLTKMDKVNKLATAAFGKKNKDGALFDYLSGKADIASATPQQQVAIKQARALFDETRDMLNKAGLNVRDSIDYFPSRAVSMSEAQERLIAQLRKVEQQPKDAAARKSLEDMLGYLGYTGETSNFGEIGKFIRTLDRQRAGGRLDAFAAFQKQGVVPEALQQRDFKKAYTNYLVTNLKAAHMRDVVQDYSAHIGVLQALGFNESADYLATELRYLTGTPSGFTAALDSVAGRIKRAGVEMLTKEGAGKLERAAGRALKIVPDFIGWTSAQAYPNLLGWKLYAPIRNLTQPLMTTVPELGKGGAKYMVRGVGRAVRSPDVNKMQKFLEERGLHGDIVMGDATLDAISEGMRSVGMATKAVNMFNKAGMYLYSKSDVINRYFTWHMAEELADDMMKGKGPAGFIKSMPAGLKAQVDDALRARNVERVKDLVGHYLVKKTQFNYTKSDLSHFGKQYGRLASMFTKWPIVITSDIAEIYKRHGAVKGTVQAAGKYFAPYAILLGAQKLRESEELGGEWGDRLLGRNLTDIAPIKAPFGVGVPPQVQSLTHVIQTAKAAMEGEWEQAGIAAKRATQHYIPGQKMYKLATGEEK